MADEGTQKRCGGSGTRTIPGTYMTDPCPGCPDCRPCIGCGGEGRLSSPPGVCERCHGTGVEPPTPQVCPTCGSDDPPICCLTHPPLSGPHEHLTTCCTDLFHGPRESGRGRLSAPAGEHHPPDGGSEGSRIAAPASTSAPDQEGTPEGTSSGSKSGEERFTVVWKPGNTKTPEGHTIGEPTIEPHPPTTVREVVPASKLDAAIAQIDTLTRSSSPLTHLIQAANKAEAERDAAMAEAERHKLRAENYAEHAVEETQRADAAIAMADRFNEKWQAATDRLDEKDGLLAMNQVVKLQAQLRDREQALGRDRIAGVIRDWIHEQPWSLCGAGADTCPDWPLAYEITDMILSREAADD